MLGKFPFPRWLLSTPVKIYQTALNEDGEPSEAILYEGKAIYDEKTKQTIDKERKLVDLVGKVIVEGDINPGKIIEGYVQVGEVKQNIYRSMRPRNPDGSVFSTELELI